VVTLRGRDGKVNQIRQVGNGELEPCLLLYSNHLKGTSWVVAILPDDGYRQKDHGTGQGKKDVDYSKYSKSQQANETRIYQESRKTGPRL
jgi:hypothetical protein